ncbi:hypothetical protein QAD02_009699 [Eretmocerus hayati]|uniref:Uncharacterized protein n=1 Tax=Eretmocerus hayati TaxID=131215 RepID=A0ACC2NBH3_9HYME|nr:hypothetical protein QAD02_009699 [Eretmocerus hayati]
MKIRLLKFMERIGKAKNHIHGLIMIPVNIDYKLTNPDTGGLAVLGGIKTLPYQYAFSVALKRNGVYYCSGGIVSKTHVVTAAHCIFNNGNLVTEVTPLQVLVGSNDYTKPFGFLIDVDSVHIPKVYFKNLKNNINIGDIAVLKLLHHLDLSITNIQTRKLFLPEATSYKGTRNKFMGFGWNKFEKQNDIDHQITFRSGDLMGQLRSIEVEVVSMNECRIHYKQELDSQYLVCGRIKQSSTESIDNVCIGDSGGPLVFSGDVLVGILIGYEADCNDTTKPQIYIRATAYKMFIQRVAFGRAQQSDTQSIILPILPQFNDVNR